MKKGYLKYFTDGGYSMAFTLKGSILGNRSSLAVPAEITVHGQVSSEKDIIVLTHIGRAINSDAYVCHISNGKYGEGIYDHKDFPYISVSGWELQVKHIDGKKYIMVCMAEAHRNPNYTVRPNWY